MFRALKQSSLPNEHVFSITVGASSKETLAFFHVLEPADIIASISLINGHATASNDGVAASIEP